MNECEKYAGAIGVDSLINYETIKHYNAEELETQRYKKAYLRYFCNLTKFYQKKAQNLTGLKCKPKKL
jgi:ABC-type transport system involved in Fe-S cluster assembly fused permease/ATPase subunit